MDEDLWLSTGPVSPGQSAKASETRHVSHKHCSDTESESKHKAESSTTEENMMLILGFRFS